MTQLQLCLLISSGLFCIGLVGALARSNTILVLLGIELMLNAANLNFIAFWRFGPSPQASTGIIFVIFSIAVAAAEQGLKGPAIGAAVQQARAAAIDDGLRARDRSAPSAG